VSKGSRQRSCAVLCCFKYHTDSCLVQSSQEGKGCMGEEVYCLPSLVCCAGGLIGQLPGEDSGVLTVGPAIHCIDPGQDPMDVLLVSLCMHKACQPCLCLCIWICPSLHCCRKMKQQKRLRLVSFVGEKPKGGLCWASLWGCTAAKEWSAQDGNTGMSGSIIASVSMDTDLSRQG
jgi:hypothetical protein